MNTRADQTHDLIEQVYGPLDDMPRHAPVIRPDVPLKPQRVQVERRTNWPTEPINSIELANGQTIQRQQPASCNRVSCIGSRVVTALCLGVLISWGLMALFSSTGTQDLIAETVEKLSALIPDVLS